MGHTNTSSGFFGSHRPKVCKTQAHIVGLNFNLNQTTKPTAHKYSILSSSCTLALIPTSVYFPVHLPAIRRSHLIGQGVHPSGLWRSPVCPLPAGCWGRLAGAYSISNRWSAAHVQPFTGISTAPPTSGNGCGLLLKEKFHIVENRLYCQDITENLDNTLISFNSIQLLAQSMKTLEHS